MLKKWQRKYDIIYCNHGTFLKYYTSIFKCCLGTIVFLYIFLNSTVLFHLQSSRRYFKLYLLLLLVFKERNMAQIADSTWLYRTHYESSMDAYQCFKATGKVSAVWLNHVIGRSFISFSLTSEITVYSMIQL